MEELQRLSSHLENRLSDLAAARGNGTRIVGYTPGGYLPEELVLAAGAVPVCMIQAGERTAVESSEPYICRWIDPFCRAQIGLATSGRDPYYSALDLLVVPITDNHIRAIADVVDYNTDLEVFPFGVPHMKEPSTFQYYLHGLVRLKERIEALTGTKITDEGLKESIRLCNRERELFRTLSTLRQSPGEAISGSSFIALNHASSVSDKRFMVQLLESVAHTVMSQPRRQDNAPRILLTGSTLAMGDTLPNLIEDSGGAVVIEEFAEGIRPYWQDVSLEGDPLHALAEAYFMDRVAPAWFRPGTERQNFLIRLARGWHVDGVIWYQLLFRESYKTESYYFPDRLQRQTGRSMLVVESDYDQSEAGQMKTRIETFLHIITGGTD